MERDLGRMDRDSAHACVAQTRVRALPTWRMRRVQQLIDQDIAEPLSLSRLARAAGLSAMHFAAQFRAATGVRPHEYLLGQRIARAKALMTTSETSLAQIALNVGFQGQSHFSTVFKRFTGETPASWRRSARLSSKRPARVAA